MKKVFDPFIESLPLKVKTRQEVAEEYGTSVKTLTRRLSKEGIELPQGDLFPNTLKIIYYTFGKPAGLKVYNNNNKKDNH
jgi:hypothetical protein